MNADIFNSSYLIFSHGSRMEPSSDSFILPDNYRLVTLHIPGKEIRENLVKLIFNQIQKKADAINNLFNIKCPIARGDVKTHLENLFIIDYLKYLFLTDGSSKIKLHLDNYFIEYEYDKPIDSLEDLNNILKNQDYDQIKKILSFEIRTYRSGDQCPKILLDFTFFKSLTNISSGIFNTNLLKNFNYDNMSELINLGNENIKSLVDFENKSYVFDNKLKTSDKLPFFNKIKDTVPSGLLILLACGIFNIPQTKLERKNSDLGQNLIYKKYYIDYNNK